MSKTIRNQKGQVMVEYVLLLIILITIAFSIVGGLVGRTNEPGSVIKVWRGLLTTIALDTPK